MDRMTELQKRKLKNMLNTCESMKRTFSQKRDKASANAFNSGSTSSYNTMHKYEAYLDIVKIAEGAPVPRFEVCRVKLCRTCYEQFIQTFESFLNEGG